MAFCGAVESKGDENNGNNSRRKEQVTPSGGCFAFSGAGKETLRICNDLFKRNIGSIIWKFFFVDGYFNKSEFFV